MKKTALVLLVSFAAVPMFGRARVPRHLLKSITVTQPDVQPVDDPTLVARVFAQAEELRLARRGREVHATTIGDVRSARVFQIPAAGSTPGGGGALFFRSDVTLINYDANPETVLVVYWQAGTSNPPASTTNITTQVTVPAGTAVTYIDFVASVMHSSGLGALLFFPIFQGTLDQNAAIDGLSRIYTRQPGSVGTVSQEFPPVDADSLSTLDTAASLGLRQDVSFRTNWGFLNADSKPHVVRIRFIGERATTETMVTVPAYGMLQQGIPAGDYGALIVHFEITDAGTSAVSWIAYATSTDNITGDGWVSIASADFTPAELGAIGLSTSQANRGDR